MGWAPVKKGGFQPKNVPFWTPGLKNLGNFSQVSTPPKGKTFLGDLGDLEGVETFFAKFRFPAFFALNFLRLGVQKRTFFGPPVLKMRAKKGGKIKKVS